METKQKDFSKIIIKAQAYDDFIDRLNKYNRKKTLTVDDIKSELTQAFKSASLKYVDEIMKGFKIS